MANWNGLDFFILLIFVTNTILGLSRGATKEILSLIGVTVAVIFTIKFTVPLTNFFNASPLIQDVLTSQFVQNFMHSIGAGPLTAKTLKELSYCIALLICFSGAYFVCEVTLNVTGFVTAFPFPYAMADRKVGGTLGAIRGYIFTLLLIVILALHIFKPIGGGPIVSNSQFIKLLGPGALRLDNLIAHQKVEDYKDVYKDKDLFNDKNVYQLIS